MPSRSIEVTIPDTAELDREASGLIAQAKAFEVIDASSYATANTIAGTLRNYERRVVEFFAPMRKAAREADRIARETERAKVAPAENARAILDRKALDWRRAEDARLADEARARAEAARKEEEEKRLAMAAAAEEAGDAELAEAIIDSAAPPMPAVEVVPVAPRVDGRTIVRRFSAECVDQSALVAFVVVWRDQPVPQAVPPLPSVSTASDPLLSAPSGAAAAPDTVEPEELVVSVVGLVAAPGLVTLAPGTRVADALTAAGGALPGADLTGINLAQRLADGDQLVVGAAPPDPPPPASSVSSAGTGAGSRASASGGAASGGAASGGAAGPVNLNTADEAALDALPGVGPVTAAAIIAWRDENGPFTDVEQLGEVDGIGPARLARLRMLVTV